MIISKTPLRVSFFGGGTDISSFYNREFGCVISTSIDKYVYLLIHDSFHEKNVIVYSQREYARNIEDIKNTRIKETMKKTGVMSGVEVHSLSEVPSGTGLGSSSSFTVGLLNLFYAYNNKYVSNYELAKEACEVEIDILKEPIGKQDQYGAAVGGLNFIRFMEDGSVEIEPIRASKETLKKIDDHLIFFYLDKDRSASKILKEQNEIISNNMSKFETMKKMKEITLKMKEELNRNNIDNFGKMLHESWLLKKSLTDNITSPEIDEIYEKGINAGAEGGKVLGAGGGGFMMFYCDPDKQQALKETLKDLREFKINFEKEGTKIIYYH